MSSLGSVSNFLVSSWLNYELDKHHFTCNGWLFDELD